MPLKKGREHVGENISTEMHKHPEMSHKQAIAIGMSAAGVSKPKMKAKAKVKRKVKKAGY